MVIKTLEIHVGGGGGPYALEIQMGGGGGFKEVWKSRWEEGRKMLPSMGGGVDFF